MSPRRLLRHFDPASDLTFVAFADDLLDRIASVAGAPWPAPEQELGLVARFERRLRRRFPYAAVEVVAGPGDATGLVSSLRVYRDGGPSQSKW